MGDGITIFTNPQHCSACPTLDVGKTYLIAGSYRKADDGSIIWSLDGTQRKSLVSEWEERYSTNLAQWIDASNSQRESFLQQCETNSELVSADQWSLQLDDLVS